MTFNVARLGKAYVGKSIEIADVVARDDCSYGTTTEHETVPLSNAPLASRELDQGMPYSLKLPDGSTSIRLLPEEAPSDLSELPILSQFNGEDLVLVLEPDGTYSLDGTEPPGLLIGDLWIVDNPALPTHGDLNQKTG